MPEQQFTLRSMRLADIAALPFPTVLFEHIIVGQWAGMPNYECPVCMYADLDRERTERHIQDFHVAPALELRAEPKAGVGLYDANNNLITGD